MTTINNDLRLKAQELKKESSKHQANKGAEMLSKSSAAD